MKKKTLWENKSWKIELSHNDTIIKVSYIKNGKFFCKAYVLQGKMYMFNGLYFKAMPKYIKEKALHFYNIRKLLIQ